MLDFDVQDAWWGIFSALWQVKYGIKGNSHPSPENLEVRGCRSNGKIGQLLKFPLRMFQTDFGARVS
jgi:hypothetical protein